MPVVRLGNPSALDGGRAMEGDDLVTDASLPDHWTAEKLFNSVTAPDGIWRNHSGVSAPSWIESDDEDLAEALSTHYGCPVGRPDNEAPEGTESD